METLNMLSSIFAASCPNVCGFKMFSRLWKLLLDDDATPSARYNQHSRPEGGATQQHWNHQVGWRWPLMVDD